MSYKLQADMEIKEDEDLKRIKAAKTPPISPIGSLLGGAATSVAKDMSRSFGGPRAGGKTGMQMARQKRMMQARARGKSLTQYGAAPQDDGLLRELRRQAQANRALTANPYRNRKTLEDALKDRAEAGEWVAIDPASGEETAYTGGSTILNQNAVEACKRIMALISDLETMYGQTDETRELRKHIQTIFYGKQDHKDGCGEVEPAEEEEEETPTNYDW